MAINTKAYAHFFFVAIACFQYTRSAVQLYAVSIDYEAYATV